MKESIYTIAVAINDTQPSDITDTQKVMMQDAVVSYLIRDHLTANCDQPDIDDTNIRCHDKIHLDLLLDEITTVINNYLHQTVYDLTECGYPDMAAKPKKVAV